VSAFSKTCFSCLQVLFKKELDKVYDPNAPEDDMREREEEMERMREHVFKESDTDKDRLISFQEFLAETKREEFEKDPGRKPEQMTIIICECLNLRT
jgi:hypothetical protein